MANGSMMKMGGNGGEVEADETFIGGNARNMHKEVRGGSLAGPECRDRKPLSWASWTAAAVKSAQPSFLFA